MLTPSELIGKVAAARLADLLEPTPTDRLVYAVLGLAPDIATAIARNAAAIWVPGVRVDACIDPCIATGDVGGARLSSDTALHHRNNPLADDVLLTVFCIPVAKVASVEGSMQHVERITDAWLLDDLDRWAECAFPGSDALPRAHLRSVLNGLVRSGAAFDTQRVAEYTVRVVKENREKHATPDVAARNALPALRLPRGAGDPGADLSDIGGAEGYFRSVYEDNRPFLHLRDRDGEPLDRGKLSKRLKKLASDEQAPLPQDAVKALTALLADSRVGDSGWTEAQANVAELPWEHTLRLFSEDQTTRKEKTTFGADTRKFLKDRAEPLDELEEKLLATLTSEAMQPTQGHTDFFALRKDKLKDDATLYRRWERLLFRGPIEVDDLSEGLLRLAERLRPDRTNGAAEDDVVLFVRLHKGSQVLFWREDKNTKLCRMLRYRWRGLAEVLRPFVELDFGLCWAEDNWEKPGGSGKDDKWEEVTSASKEAVTFRFEAYAVPRAALMGSGKEREAALDKSPRAQMLWKGVPDSIENALPVDFAVLASESGGAPLVTATISPNHYDRHGALQSVSLDDAGSVTDATGNTQGRICNPGKPENRIDQLWEAALDRIAGAGIITPADAAACRAAYDAFRHAYTGAVTAMVDKGAGLACPKLLVQAERYGELLRILQKHARADVCVRDLWLSLLTIGTARIDTARPTVLVTAAHPLRLAELRIKAVQLGEAIGRVMQSPTRLAPEVKDYVAATLEMMAGTYYPEVGVCPGGPALVAETQRRADVSLLEAPAETFPEQAADEPAKATVAAFERVAKTYLDLRPHEKASFSTVLFESESEDLPVLMAHSMAKRIEADSGLRCDLVLTHSDVASLRRVYERQNRRIGHDVDTSLTSEAARNFLSRLRVAIVNAARLDANGAKNHDVVVLQDVISRQAKVRWLRAGKASARPALLAHVPTSQSRRKPFRLGDTTSGTYLCSPGAPEAGQAFVDAVHDVLDGSASQAGDDWMPVQEVEFASGTVSDLITKAHRLGRWVMTFDRLADRRLMTTGNRRIIQYFSEPRSDHNVIVSAEITEEALGERLRADLALALPAEDPERLAQIVGAIHSQSASLSGAIVMRGAQRRNHAQELLGLVLARHQLDVLLGQGAGDRKAAWFFLDDFAGWLGLGRTGLRADLLGVDFSVDEKGPVIRLVVGEAKFVGSDALGPQRNRSLEQLAATFTTLSQRLVAVGETVDPAIWRGRLADLVLEHVDPFDQVGGIPFADWVQALRKGTARIDIVGHSLVFAHDQVPEPHGEARMRLPDVDKPLQDRRRLVQWTFGRQSIATALRALVAKEPVLLLETPDQWPGPSWDSPELAASHPVLEPFAPMKADPAPKAVVETLAQTADTAPALAEAHVQLPAEVPLPVPGLVTPAMAPSSVPPGWLPAVHAVVARMVPAGAAEQDNVWLSDQAQRLRDALTAEGMSALVVGSRLTPNSGLIEVDGKTVTVSWLEKKQTDLLTKYGLDLIRISPKPGRILVGVRRPKRAILHLAEAWRRRALEPRAPQANLALVLGEKEDDGALFYLPVASPFGDQERAAPHSIISGTTGSGKGILATSLMLDACAFNSPENLRLRLIDPKKGVDYAWLRQMPQLDGDIVETKEDAVAAFQELVAEMERRYAAIRDAGANNIDVFNEKAPAQERMPRILLFFDEVANWMQDEEFKKKVEPLINEIATKSRAAGIHMFMIYQRADNQVMDMQLRTNLGNKLVLRLGDEGSSKVAMGERGAERLLGKGHLIAKLDGDEKIYGQVPYIGESEVAELASAIAKAWRGPLALAAE